MLNGLWEVPLRCGGGAEVETSRQVSIRSSARRPPDMCMYARPASSTPTPLPPFCPSILQCLTLSVQFRTRDLRDTARSPMSTCTRLPWVGRVVSRLSRVGAGRACATPRRERQTLWRSRQFWLSYSRRQLSARPLLISASRPPNRFGRRTAGERSWDVADRPPV